MGLLFWFFVLIVALFVLVKASDFFTDAAEQIGLFFKLPHFIIGVTIVAIGTSLPELASSVIAVLKNNSEIVVGNVLGSNIANILLVLGVAALIGKRIKITYELIHVDLPLLLASTFLLTFALLDGTFDFFEALVSLFAFGVYILYTIKSEQKHKDKEIIKETKDLRRRNHLLKHLFILVVSGIFIYFGAEFTVDAVINLSKLLGIATGVIAMSVVALGTSLPELMVTISAARKGKPEIAVGNVLGSNIFNSLVVMGIPALISPIVFKPDLFILGFFVAVTILYFATTQDKEVSRWEGLFLVLLYVFFIVKLFV